MAEVSDFDKAFDKAMRLQRESIASKKWVIGQRAVFKDGHKECTMRVKPALKAAYEALLKYREQPTRIYNVFKRDEDVEIALDEIEKLLGMNDE